MEVVHCSKGDMAPLPRCTRVVVGFFKIGTVDWLIDAIIRSYFAILQSHNSTH